MAKARKVIVDLDVGTDDYLGLLFLLQADRNGYIKIEALTCTHGNTTVENVCKNVVRLLEIVKRTDIPIYKGVSKQLIPPKESLPLFHGADGFGDLKHNIEPDTSIVKDKLSPTALRDIVVDNPKEISIIALAPLTNLALAIKLYDDFITNVKDVWIMGGNHKGVGNITKSAEFNFYSDPEAAYIVLEELICPIFLLPWEPCLLPEIPLEWRYDTVGKNSPSMDLLTRAEKAVYPADYEHWVPCDAFLVACFLDPAKLIKLRSAFHATVELHSSGTRGQVVLDHLRKSIPNVTIIEDINVEEFKEMVLNVDI